MPEVLTASSRRTASHNRALRRLCSHLTVLSPVRSEIRPLTRYPWLHALVLHDPPRGRVRAARHLDTEEAWCFSFDGSSVGTSADPLDAAVRLLHQLAARSPYEPPARHQHDR